MSDVQNTEIVEGSENKREAGKYVAILQDDDSNYEFLEVETKKDFGLQLNQTVARGYRVVKIYKGAKPVAANTKTVVQF